MRSIKDVGLPHAKLAQDFVNTLDKTLNVYVGVFDDIYVSGVKDGKVVYREFAPWR